MQLNQLSPPLAQTEPQWTVGCVPNRPHQRPGSVFTGHATRASGAEPVKFELAIVEFDDQGLCHDRPQMDLVANKLRGFTAAAIDAIVIVYAHGWKHDARSDDSDLKLFTVILGQLAYYETEQARKQAQQPRPVFGVFAAWRGVSLYDDALHWLENITFWTRQAAALRVATGSVRELFGYARNYRQDRQKTEGSQPLLAIVGHSFGGKIVYSAIEQSLIEAASTPAPQVAPSFANLVLLINPAIGSISYLPVKTLIDERANAAPQLPVFVCATAKNDWATGYAFPVGNLVSILLQSWKGHEKQARWYTIGHNPWLKTNDISGAVSKGTTDYKLLPPVPPDKKTSNPFWVIQADRTVINGHSGITLAPFLKFAADLLFTHSDHSAARPPDPALHELAHDLVQPNGFGLP